MAMGRRTQTKGVGAVLAKDVTAGRHHRSFIERCSTLEVIASQQEVHPLSMTDSANALWEAGEIVSRNQMCVGGLSILPSVPQLGHEQVDERGSWPSPLVAMYNVR